MTQLLRNETEWNWTKLEEDDSNEKKKEMETEIPCLTHLARDANNTATTDASKVGLGKTLWPKQTENKIRSKAFTNRCLNDAEKG